MTARDAWLYLDCAATHPLKPAVREAMRAQHAPRGAQSAREQIASVMGLPAEDVRITAGGSAANNLALLAAHGHVISQPSEHPSVLQALDALRARGCSVELLPLDRQGAVSASDLAAVLRPDTALVTVMHANNETGCMQPVAELAEVLANHPAHFHVDAVQTAPWYDVRPAALGATSSTISLHKLGGPRGVGLLLGPAPPCVDPDLAPGVLAGVLAAVEARRPATADAVAHSRDLLEQRLRELVPELHVHGAGAPRLPGVLNVSATGVNGDALVLELERAQIAVATGAACASGDPSPSHVLRALGASAELARASVRFSLGAPLTRDEVQRVSLRYAAAVERLRSLG